METNKTTDLDRRDFIRGALAGAVVAGLPLNAFSADNSDMQTVLAQVPRLHDQTVKALQDWIALPSIAAENRNYPQVRSTWLSWREKPGLLQRGEIIAPTSGKPGVFGTLDAGAPKSVGIYFMYDVKQFDPAEWSSPPLEARIVDKEGFGKVCVSVAAR